MYSFRSIKGNTTLIAVLATAIVVGFGVYFWQQLSQKPDGDEIREIIRTEISKSNQANMKESEVAPEPKPVAIANTMKSSFEDWASYLNSDFKAFPTKDCPGYEDVHQKLVTGLVQSKSFAKVGGDDSIRLYLTPNYSQWSKTEFEKVGSCIDGAGQVGPLKIAGDHLLWGYPSCSAGWAPSPTDPTYADFQNCLMVEKELGNYLAQ